MYIHPSQTLPKDWRGGNIPKDKLWSYCLPDTNPDKDTTEKENYRPLFDEQRGKKSSTKILGNLIPQHIIKVIIHQDHPRVKRIHPRVTRMAQHTQTNVNKRKDKTHTTISIDAKKASDESQCPFMIKTLTKVGIEGIYLNTIKNFLWQTHSQHNTQWWKAESVPAKIWNRTRILTTSI